MVLELLVAAVGVVGGGIASIVGFGIGSTLTPVVSYQTGAKIAVAAVAIPHLSGTILRLWQLRRHIDYHVLRTFGIMNAAGGLVGALLHNYVQSSLIRVVFGSLLVFSGIMALTGWAERLRFRGWKAWAAGVVSGGLGGFSGTQGGIRAAALFGFELPKQDFVATATATALLVDLARTPVYLWAQWQGVARNWPLVVLATVGVLIGTYAGERVLRRVPERLFRTVVAVLILLLGLVMVFAAGLSGAGER
jgi:uncharacterized protein